MTATNPDPRLLSDDVIAECLTAISGGYCDTANALEGHIAAQADQIRDLELRLAAAKQVANSMKCQCRDGHHVEQTAGGEHYFPPYKCDVCRLRAAVERLGE